MSLTVATIIIGTTLALFLYKDRIINQVVLEINNSLNTAITVDRIDLDLLHGFPFVAIELVNTNIPDIEGKTLLDASSVYIVINPFNLIQNDYTIERIDIEEATINIQFDENNVANFKHFLTQTRESDSSDSISSFSLNSVSFNNVIVEYKNLSSEISMQWKLSKISGKLQQADNNYTTSVEGELLLNNIETASWDTNTPRDLDVDLVLDIDNQGKIINLGNSVIQYENADFDISGEYTYSNESELDLNLNGENLSFTILANLLPEEYGQQLKKYHSRGSINFTSKIAGKLNNSRLPSIQSKLEFKNVDLEDQKYNADITGLNVIATLSIPNPRNLKTSKFEVVSAIGLLQNKPFDFTLDIINFVDPAYTGQISATVTTQWLLAAMEYPLKESAEGSVAIDFKTSGLFGETDLISNKVNRGIFEFNDVSFKWSDTLSINRINGRALLDQNNLEIQSIVLEWLESNAVVDGTISGLTTKTGNDLMNIEMQSNVRSGKLHIEDILAFIEDNPFSTTTGKRQKLKVELGMNCQFDNLYFRRFHGKNINGDLLWQGNVLEVVDLNGNGMGGTVNVNGLIKEIESNSDYYIEAEALTREVNVDSLFYVFENFQQDWITDKHLKGQIFSEFNTSLYFDSTWRFRSNLLKADGKLKAVNGELNDFEPIMELSAYIDDKEDSLSRLRFSDIVNHITIQNDTIYIPEMSIQTNVRNIALGGYHTLDQHIYYQLAVPVINERVDKDEAFGAIRESSKGVPNLLFVIKGTTEDYSVNYDLRRVGKNVLKLLDITKIFKKKKNEKADSTFLEDEEFDWNN